MLRLVEETIVSDTVVAVAATIWLPLDVGAVLD